MAKKLTTKEFNALPKNKKVVLVAKDVIAQLDAKRYISQTGRYIYNLKTVDGEIINGEINKNFDKIKSCQVCALGSMLMSCTHLGNKLTTSDLDINYIAMTSELRNDKVSKLFKSIFDPHTLLLIETSYEGYDPFTGVSYKEIKKSDFEYSKEGARYGHDIEDESLTFEEAYKAEMFFRKYK